ncbi:MAG: transglycosylase SLT domain-containing protein [Rugosibacter sp.]|nr:transglycosylase SLT domain-containing protein [Rugosibacter sp.]
MHISRLLALLPLLLLFFASSGQAEQALQFPPAVGASSGASTIAPPPALALSPALAAPAQDVQDDLPRIPTIDLTTPPDDLWQRVRNGFAMPNLDSPLVAQQQAWFLNHPDLLRRIFARCNRYLYYVVAELEKRGMPTELALLPVIESSYNPMAYSSARALGMWQFIPATGKQYNLKQNAWFDERRDIVASTAAALDYQQYIYAMHGDWHLALASYNWGEGAVGRAIAKNKAKGLPTDYLHLSMPAETRNYVPKLQAIKNIIADPELFGLKLEPIPNKPYFSAVERNEKMDIAVAARLAEIPVDEFIALNPAYSRPVMPDSADSPLLLPANKVDTFRGNLADYLASDKPLSAWNTHTLQRGEKLDAVARRYGLSTARLKQLNGITRRTKVAPGLALLVPGKDAANYEAIAARLPQTPAEAAPRASKKQKGRNAAKSGGKRKTGATHVKTRKSTVKGKPVRQAKSVKARAAKTTKKPAKGRKR